MKTVLSSLNSAQKFNPELEQILEAATTRLQAGEHVDIDALAADHGEFASELRELWPVVEMMVLMSDEPLVPEARTDHGNGQAAPPPEHKQLGDFRLIRQIGRGGMGTVYEAEQLSMGRRVALKVLPFAALLHDQSLKRFRNEVRAAAALDHPHIVSIYSVGEECGVHFYAMQLIRGQTLADMIHELRKTRQHSAGVPLAQPVVGDEGKHTGKANGTRSVDTPAIDSAVAAPPSTKRVELARISTAGGSRQTAERFRSAARLGIQAAEALQHAHDQGVLHRDIKPSNLMIDREAQLYITDFGLARIEADAGMTMTGDIVGTLRYMAPEQALAKRVVIDHRADVYSLGATLYELLTLQPAFGESDRAELLKQIAFEEPRPLRKLDRRIPAELETIVLKAMAKNPEERYQTSQRLADDLRAFLESRPIKAKAPTVIERAAKWSRRHTAATRAAAILLVLTTIGSTLATALVWRANQRESLALDKAQSNLQQAEQSRVAAQQSADEREAVINFLINDILGAAKPTVDQRNALTVKEALAMAHEKVGSAFVKQPRAEVAVRIAIGNTYQSMGDFDRAQQQIMRAREAAYDQIGPNSVEALSADFYLARLLNLCGRLEEARVALEASHAAFLKKLGPRHRLTLEAEFQRGTNARRMGRYDEAVKILEHVSEASRSAPGHLPDAGADLAQAYCLNGDIDKAETIMQARLDDARRQYDPDNLRVIAEEQRLVMIPSPTRSYEDIRRVQERVLAAFRIAYGDKHYKTVDAARQLMKTYDALEQPEKTKALAQEMQIPEPAQDFNDLEAFFLGILQMLPK